MNNIKGNIVKYCLQDNSRILIHQVNCKGVMGAGLAKQIREMSPKHYKDYRISYCKYDHQNVNPLGHTVITMTDEMNVIGIYGQDSYGRGKHTNYYALIRGLDYIVKNFPDHELVIPKYIGCGLAGGDWGVLYPVLLDMEVLTGCQFTCIEWEGVV